MSDPEPEPAKAVREDDTLDKPEHWAIRVAKRFLGFDLSSLLGVVTLLTFVFSFLTYQSSELQRDLQVHLYEEERFSRSIGSINLAWRSLSEAESHDYEIGQSASLLYLASLSQLSGDIVLTGSVITFDPPSQKVHDNYSSFINLPKSVLCSDIIHNGYTERVEFNFSNGILRNSVLDGNFSNGDFLGVDGTDMTLNNVTSINSRFISTVLKNSIMHGGIFRNSTFNGADLSGMRTERGAVGYRSPPQQAGFYAYYSVPQWTRLIIPHRSTDDVLKAAGKLFNDEDNFVVDFTDVDFKNSDLRGADLSYSNILQRQIDDACLDSTTILPKGLEYHGSCTEVNDLNHLNEALRSTNPKDLARYSACTMK